MRTYSLFRLLTLLPLAATILLPGLYSAVAAASTSGGMVYFHRPAGFNGAFTKPHVIIDGKKIGLIGSGECHRIRLAVGHHRIIVRDQTSLVSRLGLELHAARINVANRSETFITVHPTQDQQNFNDPSTGYELFASSNGRRC